MRIDRHQGNQPNTEVEDFAYTEEKQKERKRRRREEKENPQSRRRRAKCQPGRREGASGPRDLRATNHQLQLVKCRNHRPTED